MNKNIKNLFKRQSSLSDKSVKKGKTLAYEVSPAWSSKERLIITKDPNNNEYELIVVNSEDPQNDSSDFKIIRSNEQRLTIEKSRLSKTPRLSRRFNEDDTFK